MQRVMRISDDTHKKLLEIKHHTERSIVWIVRRAVDNYYKATVAKKISATEKGKTDG